VNRCFTDPLWEQLSILRQARAHLLASEPDIDSGHFSKLRQLLGLACKDHYSLAEIDRIFTMNGCEDSWLVVVNTEKSERMNRVFGWFAGIASNAYPSQQVEIVLGTATDVLARMPHTDENSIRIRQTIADLRQSVSSSRVGETPEAIIRLSLEQLDPRVAAAAGSLLASRHYAPAVLSAFASLEAAIKEKSDEKDLDTTRLAQRVFSPDNPILRCSHHRGEQQGFMFLFAGAMLAVRNPRAHHKGEPLRDDVDSALEWLAFASALFRELDRAELAVDGVNSDED
jgi:uncharacterized protein (TIGR02391 family)